MNITHRILSASLVSLSLALTACPSDEEAPAAPVLDPLPAVTSLPSVVVSGTAEYLSAVAVGGGAENVSTTADARTGAFSVEVPLAEGENALRVISADAAGNTSEAVKVTVIREAPRAERIELALERAAIDADDGTLAVRVRVWNDERVDLKALGVTLSVESYGKAIEPVPLTLDANGEGRAQVIGLDAIGSGLLVATADTAAYDGSVARAEAGFLVLSGAPVAVDLRLTAIVDGNAVGPAEQISVPPSTEVRAEVTVTDEAGNVVSGAPLSLEVPDARLLIVGDTLRDLNQAGTYLVIARLGEDLLAGAATLIVLPGAPASLELTVTPPSGVAGDQVVAVARLVDAYGNVIPAATIALGENIPDTDPLGGDQHLTVTPAGDHVVGEIQVKSAGSFTFTASADGVADASAALVIIPGPPASGDVTLSPAPLVAGEETTVSVSFTDAYGNATSSPFSVTTDAPGALVVGSRILGVTRASEAGDPYRVLVRAETGGLVIEGNLDVVAADAARVLLSVSSLAPTAGDTVVVTAWLEDEFGNRVKTAAPVLTETTPEDFATAPTSADGVTAGSLVVETAGSYAFSAEDPSAALSAAVVPVTVHPGAPLNQSYFEIDTTAAPFAAGDPVPFTYSFVDAFGNVFYDVPLIVSVNAPNVVITNDGAGGGEINGLIRAGTYTVRARAVGTGLPDDVETVQIAPNPEDVGLNLQLSSGFVAEGGTVLMIITDGFGNVIPIGDVTVTPSDASITQNGTQLTFGQPGTYFVTACLSAVPSICDTEFIGVQGIVDTMPPSVAVVVESPDPAVSTTVPDGGSVVIRVDVSDDRGLSELTYFVNFGNIESCSVRGGPYLFPGGTTSDSVTVLFDVPGCAVPLDPISIIAQARDEAGNTRNSAANETLSVAAPFTINSPGFVVSVAAWQDRLDVPQDVVVDGLGRLVVTNRGDDRAIVVYRDRTQVNLEDSGGNRVDLDQPRGLGLDAAGNLFFHVVDTGTGSPGAVRVRANLTVNAPFIDDTIVGGAYPSAGHWLAIDEAAGRTPVHCGAVRDSQRVQCFTSFSAAATPTLVLNHALAAGSGPVAVAIDPPDANDPVDHLYVANTTARNVRHLRFTTSARSAVTADPARPTIDLSGAIAAGQMGDMVVAPVTGNLLVADRSGKIVRVVPATGAVTVLASGFSRPVGLTFDGSGLLVTDEGHDAVFRVEPDPASPGTF